MKKMNNKGFMLTETLIVATLIITVLLVVYVQFKSLNRKVSKSFEYNTVSSLYNLYNVKQYVEQEKFTVMVSRLYLEDYLDITSCSSIYFNSPSYCDSIMKQTGIKRLLITNENLYSLIERKPFDNNLNEYIEEIKYTNGNGYRLIAEFDNNVYSTIRVLNDDKFNDQIAGACVVSMPKKFKINYMTMFGSTLKDPLVDEAGCNSTVTVSTYENNTDSCYYVNNYSTDVLNISENEETNEATIYYSLYTSTLTIHYRDSSNNVLSSDIVINGNCGSTYHIEQYKKNILGYNFVSVSQDEVTLADSNVEVTLLYEIGSGEDE